MADAVTPLFAVARNTGRTFRTAALSYLEHGGERRYLPPIIDWFGDRPLGRTVADQFNAMRYDARL